MSFKLRFTIALALWAVLCAAGVGVVRAQTLSQCVNVSQPQYLYGKVGRHIVFICTNEANTILYQDGLSCLHSVCSIDRFSAAITRVVTAPQPKATLDAEMKVIKWDCNAPPADKEKRLCDERMTWVRANWPKWTKDFTLKGQ